MIFDITALSCVVTRSEYLEALLSSAEVSIASLTAFLIREDASSVARYFENEVSK